MFDVNSFLDAQFNEANSTEVVPVPVGEYTAVISKVDARTWVSKNDPSKSGITLDITWDIDDQAVKELLGRDRVTARQGIMLDITEDGKGLDFGKGRNVGLGRLREALGLNIPGQVFQFRQLEGRVARVAVSHRPSEDGSTIYSEIKSVARL